MNMEEVTSIPCVVCGVAIKQSLTNFKISYINANTISFANGAVAPVAYGYGCPLDGEQYLIGICELCTRRAVDRKWLIRTGNYIP